MKDIIIRESGLVLSYFDLNKELSLQADVSEHGLGDVLLLYMKVGPPIMLPSLSTK